MGELLTPEEIRKLTIIAAFSVDEFLAKAALKGGNAIDLIYGISDRASFDIDLSFDGEPENVEKIRRDLERSLTRVFGERGYKVIGYKYSPHPLKVKQGMEEFWGGYDATFKIIEAAKYEELLGEKGDPNRQATVVGPGNRRTLIIQISNFEYCTGKTQHDLDDSVVYAYTPVMLVIEKIRALCQCSPEYPYTTERERAQDYFDIFTLVKHFKINLNNPENREIIRWIFKMKKVPKKLIFSLPENHHKHENGFPRVRDTIRAGIEIKDFEYYARFLDNIVHDLEPFRDE